MQSKVSDVVLGKEKPVEESDPEYEKMKHYIFELENHLAEAQKHAYRLVKRHRGMIELRFLFGSYYCLLYLLSFLFYSYVLFLFVHSSGKIDS